jgi:hypothetical protein
MRLLAAVLLLSGNAIAAPSASPQLADMLTTSGQEGMQRVGEVFRRPSDEKENKVTSGYLEQVYEASRQGASNVFLVDATNLHDAVRASASIFAGSRSANTAVPVNTGRRKRGSHWLVAYLGTAHSDPVRWIVKDATVTGKRIRLTYSEPQSLIGTADSYPYYYWIPLGKLPTGTYEVELFNEDEKAVTLMRQVKVQSKP